MIDKDDFEDFLLMNGYFDTKSKKDIKEKDEENIQPHTLVYYICCIIWVIFVFKCC